MHRLMIIGTVSIVFAGCPTRTIYYDAGTRGEASIGEGGSTGTGGNGNPAGEGGPAGAAGDGGQSVAGQAGAPGSGGTATDGTGGQTDAGPSGGAAGGATNGGSSGRGGADGPANAGTGGTGPYMPGYVVCGSVAACPLANGGKCCWSQALQSSACQLAAANCDPVLAPGGGTDDVKASIQCDSTSDCPAGQVCCYTEIYISRSTACAAPSACVDAPPPSSGGYHTYRRQVCDPALVAPTECLSGSCDTATAYSQLLPSYLNLCL